MQQNNRMNIEWLIVIILLLTLVNGMRKCPQECVCNFDERGKFETLCNKGGLKSIPAKDLDNDIQVVTIRGPKNYLTISPIFQPFFKLEILRITDSNIPSLGKNSFWGVRSLRILDLSHNNISILVDDNFRGQDDLNELDLSKNKIYKLGSGVFRHMKELRILNLAGNLIEDLGDRIFNTIGKLKYLDLSWNPLDDLNPDVFKDIQELKVLKCRGCNQKKINPQLYHFLQMLSELDFGDNQFKYLDRDEFKDLKHLSKLKLDGNQLSAIVNDVFRYQKSLIYLDVSRNRLAKIAAKAFEFLANLTYLDLSYNKLSQLELVTVKPLTNLRSLNISGNMQMDLLDAKIAFQQLQNLTELAVSDMGPLPLGLLLPLRHLRLLNLSGNHLDNNSLHILNPLTNLELLDLSRNQLNGVDEEMAERLVKVNDVRLENNPFICDKCHMGPLIDRIKNIKWKQFPVCFLPEILRGTSIKNFDSNKTVENCIEIVEDEGYDAASTSLNFLDQGNLNTFAVLGGIIIASAGIIIGIIIVFHMRKRLSNRHNEDCGKAGVCCDETYHLDEIKIGKICVNTKLGNSLELTQRKEDMIKEEIGYTCHTGILDKVSTIDDIHIANSPPRHNLF